MLNDNLQLTFERIEKDPILCTMKNDGTTAQFSNIRVKEIINEVLQSDISLYTEKLLDELSRAKFQIKRFEAKLNQTIAESALTIKELSSKITELKGKNKISNDTIKIETNNNNLLSKSNTELKTKICILTESFKEALRRKEEELSIKVEEGDNDLNLSKLESKQFFLQIQEHQKITKKMNVFIKIDLIENILRLNFKVCQLIVRRASDEPRNFWWEGICLKP